MTRNRAILAGGALALAGLAPALAALPDTGSSASPTSDDRYLEAFLLEAEIVEVAAVGEGVTEPKKVTLRRGSDEMHGIFKDVDIDLESTVVRTNRIEREFTDRYAYEVAAYRLDRYLGIGLVPVTVVVELDGVRGSLQVWVEDHTTLSNALEENLPVGNYDLLVERLMLMYVFDALIGNIDRNYTNVLVDLGRDSFFLIDHSRSFRTSGKVPKPGEGKGVPISVQVAARLEALTVEDLQALLGDLLSRDQIRAVSGRRDRLLKVLAKHHLLPG